jgi:hypothetical protein
MWLKLLKFAPFIIKYLPKLVNFILSKFRKITIMEEKIREVAKILDDRLDFTDLSKNVKNVFVRGAIASIEMIDGKVIEVALSKLVSLVPDDKKWIVEKYLDAVLSKNWAVVGEATGSVVNVFVDVPGATEDEEEKAFAGVFVMLLVFIKDKLAK